MPKLFQQNCTQEFVPREFINFNIAIHFLIDKTSSQWRGNDNFFIEQYLCNICYIIDFNYYQNYEKTLLEGQYIKSSKGAVDKDFVYYFNLELTTKKILEEELSQNIKISEEEMEASMEIHKSLDFIDYQHIIYKKRKEGKLEEIKLFIDKTLKEINEKCIPNEQQVKKHIFNNPCFKATKNGHEIDYIANREV